MLRRLILSLVLGAGFTPAQAADPAQFFQKFFGAVQELQRYDAQRRQQHRGHVQRLVQACGQYDEQACQAIIAASGMPAAANFIAFAISFELELRRGDVIEARKSYHHALKWAERMPDNGQTAREWRQQAVKLNGDIESREEDTEYSNAPRGDLVCDAAAPANWRQACLRARDDAKGATLYRQLFELLGSRGTTFRQVLECDARLAEEERAGLACFQSRGLTGDAVQAAQLSALEFDLIVHSYIKE